MKPSPQRWGKVENAQRFPSGLRPRLFHNQTLPLTLDNPDSRSTTLRSPGFPVELGGVGALHAAFLNESSTRGFVQRSVAGNPGPVGMTIHLQGNSAFGRE